MANDTCTAVIAYEVAVEDSERFLSAWKMANEFIKAQAGFLSTRLHQAVSASPEFRFVNVSGWESADAFRNATQSDGFRTASARLDAYPVHASVYQVLPS